MTEERSGYRRIRSSEDYLVQFDGDRRKAALDRAHDIRKFEIDLYWKRAAYFWAFSAAALAGYLTMSGDADRTNTFIVCCLGFLFSLSWYLVNRGSSYWQRNWEKHVDLLEDGIEGPLHKLVVDRRHYELRDLTGPYRFSPARTNTALSLVFLFLWVVLAARTVFGGVDVPFSAVAIAFGSLSVVIAVFMARRATTGRSNEVRAVDFVMRTYR